MTWALCSPWSKSLYRELRTILEGNESTQSKTQVILKKRLSQGGKSLMANVGVPRKAVSQLIRLQLASGSVEEEIKGGNWVMTYVYFKGHIVPIVGKCLEER